MTGQHPLRRRKCCGLFDGPRGEAAYRVALSAGAKVVDVSEGPVDVKALRQPPRTWCYWSAARTAAISRSCCATPRRSSAWPCRYVLAGSVETQPEM
jgi:hypothetical protein